MISIRKYILYSTFLSFFIERFYVTVGVNLFASYVIVLFNLCLLFWVGSYWLPRGLLLFLSALFVSGLAGLAAGTNSLVGFAKDITGIVPQMLYMCAFMRYIDFDVEQFFKTYAQWMFWLALIGFVMLPFDSMGRFRSVLIEPGGFAIFAVPVIFYYADDWQRHRRNGWRLLTMLAACALTESSIGFMGCFFGLYLFGTRYRFGKFLTPALVLLVGSFVYAVSPMFQLRLDDTLKSLLSSDLSGINISSFGVVTAIFVTIRAFPLHPIAGTGLGSYVVSYDRFASQLPGMHFFELMGYGELARWDGSSLLLRILVEFGLVGLLCAIWYFFYFWPWKSTPERRAIAMVVLCYAFTKALRSGSYFDPIEAAFFVMYVVNGTLARKERSLPVRELAQVAGPGHNLAGFAGGVEAADPV